MSAIALGVAAVGAGANLYGQSQAQKAAKDAAAKSQINIDALNDQTKAIATQNAKDSAALEQQLTPLVPQLRNTALQGVISGLHPDAATLKAENILQGQLGQGLHTPLLNAAIQKAQSDLALGGQLGTDQQNLVTRGALANAGGVSGPGGGLNLGRDLTARDLGLSSLQLGQQRLQNASQLGGQEQGLGQANASNLLNKIQMLQSISNTGFGRQLGAAQFGQGIQQPNVGLDPSAIANISIGNSNNQSAALANRANMLGQQSNNLSGFLGQAAGYGLLNYNQTNNPASNAYNFNSTYQNPTQSANYFGNYNPGGK